MRLSNREKLLVLILSILALTAGFIYFIEKPALEKIETLKKTKADYENKVNELRIQTSTNNPVYAKSRELEASIRQKSEKYFPSIVQEKIIQILEAKFAASKLNPENVVFDGKQPTLQSDDEMEKILKNNQGESKDTGGDLLNEMTMAFNSLKPAENKTLAKMDADRKTFESAIKSITRLGVVITFTGDYEDVTAFLKQLEKDKRRIMVDQILCEIDTATNQVKGSLSLSIYAVPKLFFQDSDYFQWTSTGKFGKYNPFYLSGGLIGNASGSTTPTTINSDEADFFISLKPVSSDVHSLMIGKKGTDAANTTISADNPYNENVEIQFLMIGTKYYYRYKTNKDSFPADYGQAMEFVPNGNQISIEIVSSKRQNEEDLSGANIRIINDTNKKVVANVLFDDKANHRVKFVKKSGNIVVNSSLEE